MSEQGKIDLESQKGWDLVVPMGSTFKGIAGGSITLKKDYPVTVVPSKSVQRVLSASEATGEYAAVDSLGVLLKDGRNDVTPFGVTPHHAVDLLMGEAAERCFEVMITDDVLPTELDQVVSVTMPSVRASRPLNNDELVPLRS